MRSPPPPGNEVALHDGKLQNFNICNLSPVRKVNTITLLDHEAVNVFL